MKHVGNPDLKCCVIACLSSYLFDINIVKTIDEIKRELPDICNVGTGDEGIIYDQEIPNLFLYYGVELNKGTSKNFNILCERCVFFAFSALNFYKR